MRAVKIILVVLHVMVGILALMGGWAAISDPMSPFGISTDMLTNSPFRSFLIPGWLLFIFIGLGQLTAALIYFLRPRYQAYASFFASGVLLVWLLVQVLMIRTIETMHLVTFLVACTQLGLSLLLIYKKRLFPTDYLLRFFRGRRHA